MLSIIVLIWANGNLFLFTHPAGGAGVFTELCHATQKTTKNIIKNDWQLTRRGGTAGFPIENVGNDREGRFAGDRGGFVGVTEGGRVRRGPTHRGQKGIEKGRGVTGDGRFPARVGMN